MLRTIGNIFIIIFVLLTAYTLRGDLTPIARQIGMGVENAVKTLGQEGAGGFLKPIPNTSNTLEQQISTPGPLEVSSDLKATTPVKGTVSTESQSDIDKNNKLIISSTNKARKDNGNLGTLSESTVLDATASKKVDDMFKYQYFAHTSPSGMTIGTQASDAGYDYILIGENLALGDFKGMSSIVDAWMGSPGHRANILNPDYTEIGVSVKDGIYKGQVVTIAVQHFGLPGGACPEVDSTLKTQIADNQAWIDSLKTKMEAQKKQVDNSGQYAVQYGSLVSTYNALVDQYNAAVTKTKAEVDTYNSEVTTHNGCLQNYTS